MCVKSLVMSLFTVVLALGPCLLLAADPAEVDRTSTLPFGANLPGKGIPLKSVTLTVISTGDSGAGTLRDALDQANTDGVPTVIIFDPLLAGSTISPLSPLPPLLEGNTTIDADLDDDDCIPDIELDGSLAGWSFGLEIYSSDNLVHGLVINRFEADGIFLGRGAHGNVVECNYIGTDFSGTSPAPNLAQGVVVTDSDNRIGPGNVIAFNDGSGVLVEDVSADAYPGFAGLTPDYADVFPVMDLTNDCAGAFHSADGITPLDGSGMPFIDNFGARFTGTLNVSGGDYTFNLPWLSFTGRLLIDGDVVMVCDEWSESCPAVVPLPAGDHDVEVDLIVYSGYAGLVLEISGPGTPTLSTGGEPGLLGELFQLRQPSERNRITQNSIFDNGRLGISLGPCHPSISDPGDFDIGPNTRLNFPELTGFIDHDDGTFTVDGTAAAESTVELFASAPDPLGHGEGKEYLTSVVATGGTFSALITFPPGYYAVTATATDTLGNTSEFSANLALLQHSVTVTTTDDDGPGSLRDAIEEANSYGGLTKILIDPNLAGQTIHLLSPLPPWFEDGILLNPDGDCIPVLELDGSQAGWGFGLDIYSSDNLARGLVINGFEADGIILWSGAQDNVVECNYIGTDFSGTAPAPNAGGVVVQGVDNTIGPGNVIAFNHGSGVLLEDTSADAYPDFSDLTPDYAGVFPVMDFNEDCAGFHSADGITPLDGSDRPFTSSFGARFTGTLNVIGGDYTFDLPWISQIGRILIDDAVVLECLWCESSPAIVSLASGDHDIEVDFMASGLWGANLVLQISGPGAATLSTGGQPGLFGELFQLRQPSERNRITQNSIFGNAWLGIVHTFCAPTMNDPGDLDVGPNTRLNFPELTGYTNHGGGTFTVTGTAPSDSTVEIFGAAPDPSGHGEGKEYLASVTADPTGAFAVTVGLPVEFASFTATATDNDGNGNTSEFSANLVVRQVDPVTVGVAAGAPGETVEVPIYVRDLADTLLGINQPPGNRIQGFTFQVQFEPAGSVAAISAYPSVVTEGLVPLLESFSTNNNIFTYIASYDEATNPILFNLDGPEPGDEVVRLVLTIDPAAPLIPIDLTLLDGTLLSNQAGTRIEYPDLFPGRVDLCPIEDLNCDCVLDVADVIYLINHLFAGGPPSPCRSDDVNRDGVVNGGDVIYLINLVFGGGPARRYPAQPGPSDVLALATVSAAPGSTVAVPVHIRDVAGTPLDQGTDAIQGFGFRVDFPPEMVASAEFVQAGVTANKNASSFTLSPTDHVVVLLSFNDPLHFTGHDDLIGQLVVELKPGIATGSTVDLVLDAASALVNHDATVSESIAKGTLILGHGAINVCVFCDGFESGDLSAWSSSR